MATYSELITSRLGPGPWFGVAERTAIRVEGPDAADFLHRLCTQDVLGLAVGAAKSAAFLDPKGKLQALTVIGRLAKDRFVVATPAETGGTVHEILDRYHFTEKLERERLDDALGAFWVGESPLAKEPAEPGTCTEHAGEPGSPDTTHPHTARLERLLSSTRRGAFVVAHAMARAEGTSQAALAGLGGAPLDVLTTEVLRLAAGMPKVGVDTDAKTLGLEARIEDAVALDKGCYTGQEIIARIHTYGHVNRKLCLLGLATGEDVPLDTPLLEPEDGDPVGRVRSTAQLDEGHRLAFGYLPKDFWAAGSMLHLGTARGPEVTVLEYPE